MEVAPKKTRDEPKEKRLEGWMMAKIVARMVKMKAGNLGGIQRHNQRETDNHSNEDIDTERSYLNYDLVNESPVKYNEHIREIIDSQKVSNRAVRKDAVLVDEWIITSEKSFFEGINQREFFQSAVDYFSDRCGSQNIAYATVHLDETTPHMHLGIVPMTEGRLSSKAVFNRQSLKEIQEELPIYLLNQGFDIERGLRGSERQHLSVPEYKEVQEKVAELNERLPAFRERAEKLVQKENHLAEKVRTLDEMANDALETLEVARGEGDYAYEWTDKNINSIFTEKKSLLGKPFHVVRHEDFLELKNKAASLYTDKGLNNKLRKKVQSLQIENNNLRAETDTKVAEAVKEIRRENTELRRENKDLKIELQQTEEDVSLIVQKSEQFLKYELGEPDETVQTFKAFLGKGKSLNFTWEFLKPVSEKISLMADRAYKRISEKVAIPKAVRFVQRVVERGRGMER